MLEQICAYLHNYFLKDKAGNVYGRHPGPFPIVRGGIAIDGYEDGDYFLIRGSRRNDGVYRYPTTELVGDTLDGEVWEMRPPKLFLALVADIEAWQAKYGDATLTPYQSESFGGYSYSLKSGGGAYSSSSDNAASSWHGVFASRLNEWRKLI